MTMRRFDLFDDALVELAKSLEKATSDLERFYALFAIAWIGLDYANFVNFAGNKEEQVGKAYDAIIACLEVRPPLEADSKNFKDVELRGLIQDAITVKARCEVSLGRIDDAMRTMEEAQGTDKESSIGLEIMEDITAALEERSEWDKIISVIERSNKWDLIFWLGWDGTDKQNDRFQRAAKECDKQTFMIQTYEKVIIVLELNNLGSKLRLQLAKAYRNVFQNFNEAKRLLKDIVEGRKGGSTYEVAGYQILEARLELTEVLMEEFRVTTDPKEKLMLFHDLKRIVLQDRIALADDFNPYESQTAIPIALMARKVGPPSEFQDGLEKTFTACIEALRDDEGWNDRGAFRLLAKVLACVPGLERDAQISLSLQFSIVDPNIGKMEEGFVEKTDAEDDPNDEGKGQKASDESEIATSKNTPLL
jgi:tetratricopeptide (TPR) repeat protein